MATIITNSTLPGFQASSQLAGEYDFEIGLFRYAVPKNKVTDWSQGDVRLVIGYKKSTYGEYSYVVICNREIDSGMVHFHEIDKDLFESKFLMLPISEAKHKVRGILQEPKSGDTVMCVGKGRYLGVDGGLNYENISMVAGRVSVDSLSTATYEPNFFVVIKSGGKLEKTDWAGEADRERDILAAKLTDGCGKLRVSIDPSDRQTMTVIRDVSNPSVKKVMKLKQKAIEIVSVDGYSITYKCVDGSIITVPFEEADMRNYVTNSDFAASTTRSLKITDSTALKRPSLIDEDIKGRQVKQATRIVRQKLDDEEEIVRKMYDVPSKLRRKL